MTTDGEANVIIFNHYLQERNLVKKILTGLILVIIMEFGSFIGCSTYSITTSCYKNSHSLTFLRIHYCTEQYSISPPPLFNVSNIVVHSWGLTSKYYENVFSFLFHSFIEDQSYVNNTQ